MFKSITEAVNRSIRPAFSTRLPFTTNFTSILSRSFVSKTIYVANIPWSVNEQMLRELGTKYGEVASVRLPLDFEGRARGFGFIEYNDEEVAQKALESINGYEYEGRQLRAEEASGPRYGGRGFGNRDNSEWDRRRSYGDE
ncbi:5796_t:CDS:2 [Funneliformis geosporum]|uniref:14253_t:CDS:1 n=1 Tax=Funneliformis geosporum TaxID=1117311 RepID=A0A9W4SMC1_9GLOM|nr:14253_t:CDS:2 [Funneliformis geosporum]CAI2174286.1 5796_t:CDS:2 [Funneliformis geosporum]